MRTWVLAIVLATVGCAGTPLPVVTLDGPARDGGADLATAACPPHPACDADGHGLMLCPLPDGGVPAQRDGLYCVTSLSAPTAPCVPTDVTNTCKGDVALIGQVVVVPDCALCG